MVELESVTAAANELYISQSTASSRIAHLEESLGVSLILRAKGIKTISLTPAGEAFLPIAQQWMALYQDAENLKNADFVRHYKVSANNTLNYFVLPAVFRQFEQDHPEIMIESQTEHSMESHRQVAGQTTDLALVYTQHSVPNIVSQPLFQEDMVFICHQDSRFASSHRLEDLQDAHEIYARWSSGFEIWHQRRFPYFRRSKIVIGSASLYPEFLCDKEDWAIVSRIVGECIHRIKPEFILVENTELPQRTAYVLTHKYPKPGVKTMNDLFLTALKQHLHQVYPVHLADPAL